MLLWLFLAAVPHVADLSDWGAEYKPKTICALGGSTVRINCTYKHPADVNVTKKMWLFGHKENETTKDQIIAEYPNNGQRVPNSHRQRVQFPINENKKTCDVKISNMSQEDSGYYKFRYEGTDHWTQVPGVHVTVTGLKVETTAEKVKENDKVTLRCTSNCSLTKMTFSWFRNGEHLKETSETLEIQRDDLSSYWCQTGNFTSPKFKLSIPNHMNPLWFALPGLIILAGLALAVLLFLRKRPKKKRKKNANVQEGKETFNNPIYEGIAVSRDEPAEHEGKDGANLNYVSVQF